MSDMKKVMMNDHVEDRKPAWGALLGSSGPSSPLSPSSSEPSSIGPSCQVRESSHHIAVLDNEWRLLPIDYSRCKSAAASEVGIKLSPGARCFDELNFSLSVSINQI